MGEPGNTYVLRPITRADAEEISGWRYPEPYSTYDGNPSAVPGLLDPRYNYHAVFDDAGELVGYFCFGADATIPEGRLGLGFVLAGLRFAREKFSPAAFRLTVAAFNRRAVAAYEKAGFELVQEFGDRGPEWLLMKRPA